MPQSKRKEKERAPETGAAPAAAAAPGNELAGTAAGEPQAWSRPEPLTRRGWMALGAVVLVANLPLLHYATRGEQPATVDLPYQDDFSDPSTIQRNYWTTGALWRTVDGWLLAPGAKNNPLWLKARLPQDVVVELDVRSESPEGDAKVEIFGDGLNHASGYVLIHGGWNNSISIIARLDEHGRSLQHLQQEARRISRERGLPSTSVVDTGVFQRDTRMRVEANPYPVQMGKVYRWRIERRGSLLRWSIDGKPFMELDDPFPLAGPGHDRFGFSGWEAQLYFDNLKITPL